MVKTLHAAGIEVILDVVYNHTCEGNHLGPTLSLRGIDNATYYWLMPEARYYLDFTGTGNSVNASNPEAARLIVDSLRYWINEMHVDGFRFDLATTIGRVGRGEFDRHAPIFQIINQDPTLSRVKLIAEPWDTGMGGYQVGNFPAPWREWNGKFRDALRRYWKGDRNLASELGYRLTGSADLFLGERRQPQASINFITAHDGFTLQDLVSYGTKHNEANGEDNRDGADDNQSWNAGVEGETDDPEILALRERQKRNLLAALFVSQGVPMLLAGDEMGRTQGGNNNAYCQDNEISWIDWKMDDRRRRLIDFTRRLIELRRRHPVLQRRRFFVGDHVWDSQSKDLTWLRPDGSEMNQRDWRKPWLAALAFMLGGDAIPMVDDRGQRQVGDGLLVLMNPHHKAIRFKLPSGQGQGPDDTSLEWLLELDTADEQQSHDTPCSGTYELAARSMAVFRQPLTAKATRAMPAADRVATSDQAEAAPGGAGRIEAEPGRRRRAGIMMPLFSIRTPGSWGAGSINDIPRLAGWANQAGFSLLQLLPVNTASGADPSPYAATSAFALDPVYLSLDDCEDFLAAGGRDALSPNLRADLETLDRAARVDWAGVRSVKREAIRMAFGQFLRTEWEQQTPRAKQLSAFKKERRAWVDDYALFTVWHDQFGKSWTEWPIGPRDRDPGAIAAARREHQIALLEQAWLQWQLDLQWQKARLEASAAGVELMGDLSFMVSMDSADVWANRALFHTDWHVGTPPEEGAPEGQDWGLPVYDWVAHQRTDFSWIRSRAARAGELYGLCRIDHAVGFYRTFFRSVDGKTSGFTPPEEGAQIRLGETVMRVMRHWGEVVAEDLGTQPPFLRPSLERLGIPGYRVLRWERDGEVFRDPATWPAACVATNTTHDTDMTADWYDHLPAAERAALLKLPGLGELDPARPFDDGVRDALLKLIYSSPSTLALVPFQDAMGSRERINVPGTVDPANWTYRMAITVDALADDSATTNRLAKLASDTGRDPEDKP
jgi:4-alpha-glucanotransferase